MDTVRRAPRTPLDAARYRRLRDAFDTLVALPPERRDAWIEDCALPGEDRAELRRLLAADAARSGLETPPEALAASIGPDPAAWARALDDRVVGGFRLVRPIGEGGMAAVFLGERVGTDFRQVAAVKLLRRGLHSELERALFRREQRALAMLSHPNITHLIDGGITADGIPYLVMEYVEGVPITQYAAERGLALRDRLVLFSAVCGAVAAAHRALVVHRDIKPSNILVTAAGEPKLLDFGIAKLLGEADDDATRSGFAPLTRAYAAPEQLRGGPVTTATDVHALGLLLHELLVGERPDPAARRMSSQLARRRVDRAALPMPDEQLRRALRGDLDNIVAKATADEPEARYGSAAELAEDVARHLAARPVLAHPPSAGYRLRKLVERHRLGVVLGAAAAVALAASFAATLWQARIAREQAAAAQQQAARALEIGAFVEALFEPLEAGSAPARAPSLRELLDRARARVEARYPAQPEVRADLIAMFARINDALGETTANREVAAAAVRANEAAYGVADPRSANARELHARVLRKLGDYRGARAELERTRALMTARDRTGQPYGRLLDALVAVGYETGMTPGEAIALEREALDARLADPAATADDRATAYNNLGGAYAYAGDPAAAIPWYERALAVNVAATGESVDVASNLLNLGSALSQSGRWPQGLAKLHEARAMFERLGIESHPALVSLLLRLCGVETELEAFDDAAETCARAEAMTVDVHGDTHPLRAAAFVRRAALSSAHGDENAAEAGFAAARSIAAAIESEAARRHLLAVVDAGQARHWWLTRDYPALRDAMLALVDDGPGQHPRLGSRAPGGFYFASLAARACRAAPVPACDRVADQTIEALLREAPALRSALRLPARIALGEALPESADPRAAAAALEDELDAVARALPPTHSLRAQAHLVLAALRERAGEQGRAAAHRAQAEAVLLALPETHLLRR